VLKLLPAQGSSRQLRSYRNGGALRRYVVGAAISSLGSRLTQFALPVLVLEKTGSTLDTSLTLVVTLGPYLLFGFIAGVFADRHSRWAVMIGCDIICAGIIAVIPIILALRFSIGAVLAIAAISAGVGVFFDAAAFSSINKVASGTGVAGANRALSIATTTFSIAAPPVGSLIFGLAGATPLFIVDACSFVVSALVIASLRGRLHEQPAEVARSTSWRRMFREGMEYLASNKIVRTLTLCGTCNALAGGATYAVLVVFAVRELHVPIHSLRIGVILAAAPISSVVAGALLPYITRATNAPRITQFSLFCSSGLLVLLTAVGTNFPVALGLLLVWGFFFDIVALNAITIRAQVVPAELRGRVNTVARTLSLGAMPVGALVGGLLANGLSVRYVFGIMGVASVTGGAIAVASGLGRLEVAPTSDAQ
jgi:MFS family permease